MPSYKQNKQSEEISAGCFNTKFNTFGPIYLLSQDEHKALFRYIKNNLSKDFICCLTSSAASPILFIKQKTRDLHLCVDYQGLNAITKEN